MQADAAQRPGDAPGKPGLTVRDYAELAPTPVFVSSDDERKRAAQGMNAFAAALWDRVRARPGNLAVSPASLALALTMAYAGARGPTAAQMRQVLRFGLGDEQLHTASGDLVRAWNPTGEPYELRVANRVFAERTLPLEPPYVALTRDRYGAELGTLDLLHAPGPSVAAINAWVAGETNGHIHDLVTADMLAVDSRVVLVNAVYFNGPWAEPFKRSATRDAAFTLASGQRVETPTMHAQQHYGYAEVGQGVKLLQMLYHGLKLEMILALPRDASGLASLEEQLAGGALDSWLAQLRFSRVKVALPAFRIEPSTPLLLAADLRAMGMPLAFSNDADFGAMSRDASVRISDVIHEAFVKVNEEGTEAAAATGFIVAGVERPPRAGWPEFIADHPFLFFVRDVASGAILFWGRVADPRSH